jgi:hypothetical protein
MATIQSEIDRIKENVKDAYTSLSNKGATMPSSQSSDNLASTIDSIEVADVSYDISTNTLTITLPS